MVNTLGAYYAAVWGYINLINLIVDVAYGLGSIGRWKYRMGMRWRLISLIIIVNLIYRSNLRGTIILIKSDVILVENSLRILSGNFYILLLNLRLIIEHISLLISVCLFLLLNINVKELLTIRLKLIIIHSYLIRCLRLMINHS